MLDAPHNMDLMQQIRAEYEVNKYLQLVASNDGSNDGALVQLEPSIINGSLNDRLELAIIRLAVHGAFIVLTEGSHAHFIAGGHKVNPNDAFSGLDFGTGENAWLHFDDADLPTWLWLFQQTIANDSSTTRQDQIFTIPALQHRSETAKLSTVVGSPHLSFYAGVPLVSQAGQTIGTLFVVNTAGRSPLSVSEATFLISIGVKCVEVLDRAREQSFHNRWIVLQEQLDAFAQSPSLRTKIPEEPQTSQGRTSPTIRTNVHGLERVDPDAMSKEARAWSVTPKREGMESERPAHCAVDHDKLKTRCHNAHNVRTLTSKVGKDDQSSERSQGPGDTVYRNFFRKAAQCLKCALGADGVLFAGGLVGLCGEVQPTADSELELVRKSTGTPRKDSDAYEGKFQSNTQTFTSAEYLKCVYSDRPAEISGISGCSDQPNLAPTSKSSAELSRIDEGFLERLMDRHPTGAVWYFANTCILEVKEGTLIEAHLQEEMERLRFAFPDTKQLMYVPLNNPTSAKRLCACFVWRSQAIPVFTGAADLGSLKVFSRVVELEVERYDTSAAAKQKETFVSSVSHELRTPLHGILGAVQLLDESGLDPLQKSLADIITSCGSTLYETLTSVLSYAKINQFERRQNESRRQPTSDCQRALSDKQVFFSGPDQDFVGLYNRTNVALLCEEVVGVAESGRSFQSSADEEVIVVCNISYEENWSYFTESGALRRIAVNLIGNALKYTERGAVTVSLAVSMLNRESLRADNDLTADRMLILSVKDTGKGMSKEFLQNYLFVPFTQENSTSSNGVGLGMSMVKSLVTLLSGEIQVRSDVNSGTQIDIHLPMRICDSKDECESSPSIALEHNTKILRTRRLSVVMYGFPESVRTSLKTYFCEWYNCTLLDNTGEVKPDIVLVDEGNEEALEEVKKTASVYGQQAVLLSAVLVISKMGKRMDVIRGYKKWERIPRPIGPSNVGKGLMGCLPKLDELKKYGHEAAADIQESTSRFDERTGELSSDSTKGISNDLPMWAPKKLQVPEYLGDEALKRESPIVPKTANHDPEPAAPNQSSNSRSGESHNEHNSGLRILLVDDNELNLKILLLFLKRNGYHNIQKATNGSEAVQTVQECQDGFDVVFMDLSMPIMDGFEATRMIRRSEANQNPPDTTKPVFIVALTGLASTNDEKNAFDAGVDMYLTKPLQFTKLSTLLREYTDKTSEESRSSDKS